MEQTEHRGWMWGRRVLAVFLALMFLGIVLPNTGRVVIDRTTMPLTPHIVGHVHGRLIAIALAGVPLALVCVGTFRRSQIAIPGWNLLLVVLVAIAMMKCA